MKNRCRFFVSVGVIFCALMLMAGPSRAQQDVEAQIKALEAEVQKMDSLKEQIEQLRSQQIEMKKEATSAAAALPEFSYRPGRGMTIAAADKSWSFNTTYRLNIYNYNIINGKPNFRAANGDQVSTGATGFELFPRRNRLYWTFCWSDCFIEVETSIDGEEAPRNANFRDNEIFFHFEQFNEFLPYFSVGLRRGAGRTHISRSSDNDGKVEHSIILDGFGWGGDGSHSGLGLGWDEVDIGPSKNWLFINLAASRQGTHQEFVNDDRKGLMTFIGTQPFGNVKNKWIQGFEVGFGYQAHSQNRPENMQGAGGVQEIRVRNAERRGRFDLFRPSSTTLAGAATSVCDGETCDQNFGNGWSQVFIPGFKWTIGPYMLRAVAIKTQFAGKQDGMGGIEGKGWTVDNQIFLWSPKGFLTGSQTTPHSIMLSWGFERGDMDCGTGCDASPGAGSFHSNTVLNRETALWYWIRPSFGVGMWHHWWTSSNTPVNTQVGTGCKDSIQEATAGKGASRKCDFHSFNTGIRYRW
jgi:hypothetical protein